MASIAPSKWSVSVHGHERWLLKAKLYVTRFYSAVSIPVITFYALILCGCTSTAPLIPTIFLAELRSASSNTITNVRFGYFGVCVSNNSSSFKCTPSVLSSPATLASSLSETPQLTIYALTLQESISFFTPCIASVLFLVGLINLGCLYLLTRCRRRSDSFVTRKCHSLDNHIQNLVLASRCLLWGSSAVCLASAQAMHASVRILGAATMGLEDLTAERGNLLECMLWSTFALSILFNILMQISTTDISMKNSRVRKSTPLPFLNQRLNSKEARHTLSEPVVRMRGDGTRSESIRKITTATAQRLAQVGMHNNQSEQSVATTVHVPGGHQQRLGTPTTFNSTLTTEFQALNSPGLYPTPPLATLHRSPSTAKSIKEPPKPGIDRLAPLPNIHNVPNSPFRDRSSTNSSFTERRQDRIGNTAQSGQTMTRIEILPPLKGERSGNGIATDRFAPLSPGLQGILRNGQGSPARSSIYSRPAASPREKKGQWV